MSIYYTTPEWHMITFMVCVRVDILYMHNICILYIVYISNILYIYIYISVILLLQTNPCPYPPNSYVKSNSIVMVFGNCIFQRWSNKENSTLMNIVNVLYQEVNSHQTLRLPMLWRQLSYHLELWEIKMCSL